MPAATPVPALLPNGLSRQLGLSAGARELQAGAAALASRGPGRGGRRAFWRQGGVLWVGRGQSGAHSQQRSCCCPGGGKCHRRARLAFLTKSRPTASRPLQAAAEHHARLCQVLEGGGPGRGKEELFHFPGPPWIHARRLLGVGLGWKRGAGSSVCCCCCCRQVDPPPPAPKTPGGHLTACEPECSLGGLEWGGAAPSPPQHSH